MSYSRTMGAPPATRDPTIPRFHMEAVEDPVATRKEGRPKYIEEERVQIILPGSPNSPVLRVEQQHIDRWPEYYKAFKEGQEFSANGFPIEQWPFLRKVNVLELKAKGIHTVEQCAALSDLQVQQIQIGGLAIRENAKAYLDDAEAMKIVTQAIADKEDAERARAHLQSQLDELRPMMDKMFSELQALRNAPSPIQTYVQGDNDPMHAARYQPTPAATAATQELPMPRQRGKQAA